MLISQLLMVSLVKLVELAGHGVAALLSPPIPLSAQFVLGEEASDVLHSRIGDDVIQFLAMGYISLAGVGQAGIGHRVLGVLTVQLVVALTGKYPSFACVPLLNPFPTIPPVPTAISDCRKFQLTPIPFGSITSGQIKDIILSL